jgi:hypothetical protein
LRWPEAQPLIELGFGLAHTAHTKRGPKWIRLNPGDDTRLSFFELYYHPSYPGAYAGKAVPWLPARCDLLESGWFIHPLAPVPETSA